MDNYKIRLMYNRIDYEIDQNKIKYSRETVDGFTEKLFAVFMKKFVVIFIVLKNLSILVYSFSL